MREAGTLRIPCPFNVAIVLTVKALEARARYRAESPKIDEAARSKPPRAARNGLSAAVHRSEWYLIVLCN